ncbi:MAG: hypothetical protein QOH58_3461 [Thermoleophilaceae bacterium]|jgi:phospholipase/carboxylesterase|nr:hypothetical protein [Thermoleophilaceae bacterium]
MALRDLTADLPDVDVSRLGSKPETTDYVPFESLERHRRTFPVRPGPAPAVTNHEPQEQLDQLGPEQLWDELMRRSRELPGVTERPSAISVEGARALWLDDEYVKGPEDSMIIEKEFAHIHPRPDSSWHLQLPYELAVFVISAGWGQVHTTVWLGIAPANSVMLYSPRNEAEMEIVWALVEESYRYATGQPQEFRNEPLLA